MAGLQMKQPLGVLFATFLCFAASLATLFSAGVLAASCQLPEHPRIGLVLSGGGAKGSAHIGVLKVLEEERIPIHAIAGTSMGSLVGGAYSAGLSAQELDRRVTQVDWSDLFDDDPPRKDWPERRKESSAVAKWNFSLGVHDGQVRLPTGAISGQKVQLFFNDLVKGVETTFDFDRLPIPFRAVATNLENGEMKVFDRGPLPVAMRASMAVPGVFAPMEWQDHIYVDGGLVRNLPVDVARSMGVDVIIAVNLGSGYLPRDKLGSIFGVTGQMIAILTEQNVKVSLGELRKGCDLLILPDLGDISSSDFNRAKEAIATGEVAASKVRRELRRFSLSKAEYAAWKAERFGPGDPVRRVGDVRIAGLTRVNSAVFDELVESQEHQPLEREQLVDDIQSLYGRGDFERISYRFQPQRDGSDLLIVDAVEKAWGPGYIGFGLGFSNDNLGDSRFGLRATYDQTWINRLGAEWSSALTVGNAPRFYSEFYQPLSLDRALFVAPYVDVGTSPESVFIGDQRVARYDLTRLRLGADLGTNIADIEARVGLYYGQSEMNLDTGSTELPEGRSSDSGLRARLLYDTLDSVAAPRSGLRISLETLSPLKAMGADVDYTRAFLKATAARSFGANTMAGTLKAGTSFGAEMLYQDQFPLGGFLQLSGYANDQFRGNDMAFAGLAFYRQIASLPPPLGRGLYLGASLEAGWVDDGVLYSQRRDTDIILNEGETHYGGSFFFGSDTWLGPAYLGIGLSGEGDSTVYVLIGNR